MSDVTYIKRNKMMKRMYQPIPASFKEDEIIKVRKKFPNLLIDGKFTHTGGERD